MAACAFFYLAIFCSDGDPPQVLVVATLALIPLEFARALVTGVLADSFKESNGPRQALHVFLLSMLCLVGLLIILGVREKGITATFKWLTDPDTLKLFGVPMLIMVADGVVNILTFRGDPGTQARKLDTISNDSAAWLQLMVTRVPIVLALVYFLLLWFRRNGYAFAAWLPDPEMHFLREVAWSYCGCYFLGKAALIAHVQTSHYARTGRGLADVAWIRWLLRMPQKAPWRRKTRGSQPGANRPRVKSVLAFEEDVIRSAREKSESKRE